MVYQSHTKYFVVGFLLPFTSSSENWGSFRACNLLFFVLLGRPWNSEYAKDHLVCPAPKANWWEKDQPKRVYQNKSFIIFVYTFVLYFCFLLCNLVRLKTTESLQQQRKSREINETSSWGLSLRKELIPVKSTLTVSNGRSNKPTWKF